MIYVLYGKEEDLLKKELYKIKEREQIDSLCISYYDLETSTAEMIVEDLMTISMFGSKKLVVVQNAYILTGKKGNEQNIEILINYIENSSEDAILVFSTTSEKLDERKKIVKLLKKKATIIEKNSEPNIRQFIKELFAGYQILPSELTLFETRVGNNLSLLEKEAEKLKIYKYDDKIISREDILEVTSETTDLDIFKFIDTIINKKKKEAIYTYEELVKRGEEPIAIIVMLANQIRIMYQSKELLIRGYSEKGIALELGIHPYRVKKALEKSHSYTSDTLLRFLWDLQKLDEQIKTGTIDKFLGLELFILGM